MPGTISTSSVIAGVNTTEATGTAPRECQESLTGRQQKSSDQCPSRDSNQQRSEMGAFIAEGLLFSCLPGGRADADSACGRCRQLLVLKEESIRATLGGQGAAELLESAEA